VPGESTRSPGHHLGWPMSETFLLEMRNITKSFGGIHALQHVSFACRPGKVHALVGENGAGKSTLMKILAGAYQADDGEIIYKGQTYTNLSTIEALGGGIRVIYQELNLVPYLSVAENIFLGHEPRTRLGLIDNSTLYQQSAALLQRLGLDLDLRAPVGEFPVAVQQMVEIAKALSQKADLIVMDEPSAILAGDELDRLFEIIAVLIQEGVTIIYISHRLDEIFRVADDVTILKDGTAVGTYPIAEVDRPQLVRMMVGREMSEVFPPRTAPTGEPVLIADQMTTSALPLPFSLTIHAGEIVGLAGMVGSGRTELARALFGADRIHTGRLIFNGSEVTIRHPGAAVKTRMAFVPEDRKDQGLFLGLPIRHNVSVVILNQLTRFGFIQNGQETAMVGQAQQHLDIQMASPDQEVRFLSGGNQQKVVLAKWLEAGPSLIILDEPTRGVDVGAKFEIYHIMRRLTEQGIGILMISSELPEILGMSDRILVMNSGRIAGEFARDEATEEKILQLATTDTVFEDYTHGN
jgi:ribose transport system ATP-binding protein